MDLGVLFTISCVLTAVSMTIMMGIILFFVRYGGQGVKMLFDRFLGGGDKNKEQAQTPGQEQTQRQPAVASSQSLRQRAQQLDFPAPGQATASAGFGAQAANSLDFPAPQQASLTPRGQFPDFNPQGNQPAQAQSFQLSTPSLSPSRPFQAGSQFTPNPAQQQQQRFGQQPLQGNQYGQQAPQQRPRQQPLQGNQYGQQQAQQRPSQQSLQGNQYGQQAPQQQGLGPLPGQQPRFNAQGLNPPANPQQGALGQNRPPLRSVPRPGDTRNDPPIGRRDNRRGDNHDLIYDDQRGGGNLMDDVGDFIDNF